MKAMDVVIVGVGGQGTLLASRILGALADELGADVKVSEVHGMSQRGGSVITYVRLGDNVASPMVDMGSADYILAFEQLEALRALPYLKKGGSMIVNTQKIWPMPVITGAAAYPGDVIENLREKCDLTCLDALSVAVECGEARAVNLVLLGVMASRIGGDKQAWIQAVKACVPERLIEVNLKAFERGYAMAQSDI